MSKRIVSVLCVLIIATSLSSKADGSIPTCSIHNDMKVWFLDYAEDDYTSSRPLGVLEGTVEIDEHAWRSKCGGDGPGAKIFVPFTYVKNGKTLWDSRWPQDVYRTKAEAEAAYQRH